MPLMITVAESSSMDWTPARSTVVEVEAVAGEAGGHERLEPVAVAGEHLAGVEVLLVEATEGSHPLLGAQDHGRAVPLTRGGRIPGAADEDHTEPHQRTDQRERQHSGQGQTEPR